MRHSVISLFALLGRSAIQSIKTWPTHHSRGANARQPAPVSGPNGGPIRPGIGKGFQFFGLLKQFIPIVSKVQRPLPSNAKRGAEAPRNFLHRHSGMVRKHQTSGAQLRI
jgi:hypothetical protein